MPACSAEGAPEAGPDQKAGEAGRRRRRRRGRRGGRDRERPHDLAAGEPQEDVKEPAAAYVPDRFGIPDEIDTTPSTGRAPANAPSAPAWSLTSEPEIDTTPSDEGKPVKKGR